MVVSASAVGESDYTIWIPRSPTADALYRFIKDGNAGYIDATGKVLIPPTLPYWGGNGGGEFHDGLLEIDVGGGVYVDRSGRKVIDKGLYRGWDFSEGLATALEKKEGGKWGYINTTGEFAISPRFPSHPDGYVSSFAEGLAAIETGERVGYIDQSGSLVIAQKFLEGHSFHDGMARVVAEGPCVYLRPEPGGILPRSTTASQTVPFCKYTFIDKTGSILSPQRYDDAGSFSEGVAPVRIGEVWGYVDKQGRTVISPKFDTAAPFSDGLALVSEKHLYGYIDHSGAYVIRPQFEYGEDFADGLAVVGEPLYRCWYIDHRGNRAIPDDFAIASPFFKGIAHVKLFSGIRNDKVWGRGSFAYVDRTGKIIFSEER